MGCKRTTLIRMEWKVQWNIEWQFFRSSARTYQIPSAKHEFWIKYFLLNCVPFEMSMVIFIFPCHTDQRSPRPIRGSSRIGTKITNVQLKSILTLFFYLAETPDTGLASHIHLHAVLAKWRVKHTANIIYVIMTHLKIWPEWIKSLFNPNPK